MRLDDWWGRAGGLLIGLFVCAISTAGAPVAPAWSQLPPEQMNFLVIVTDDQRTETMKVMRHTREWLAGSGTSYPNAFATTPLCCPSRASLFTGRYAHNHGVQTNGHAARLDPTTTVQYYLHNAGYRTGIFGKYLNGWNQAPPFFDSWATSTDHVYHRAMWNDHGRERRVKRYGTTFIRDQALKFLDESELNDEQPWLMFVTPQAPHAPYTPERSLRTADVPGWRPGPSVNAPTRRDKPFFLRYRHKIPTRRIRAVREDQLRTLISVDRTVRDLKLRLEGLEELDRTVVFFLSDNGFAWGEHRMLGTAISKSTPYSPAIGIPMLTSIPTSERNRDHRLVAPLDIAPTIMAMTPLAIRTGAEMDGRSLLDAWTRDWLLIERWETRDASQVPEWHSLRRADAQYMRYIEHGGIGFREYYDLSGDPGQLDNLLVDGDGSNDPDIAELDPLLDRYVDCTGSDCP